MFRSPAIYNLLGPVTCKVQRLHLDLEEHVRTFHVTRRELPSDYMIRSSGKAQPGIGQEVDSVSCTGVDRFVLISSQVLHIFEFLSMKNKRLTVLGSTDG